VLAVFEAVAVVAELDTFPAVEIVLSFESAIEPANIVLVTVPVSAVFTTPLWFTHLLPLYFR
jgi:predicted dinucleotide-binding enzyme